MFGKQTAPGGNKFVRAVQAGGEDVPESVTAGIVEEQRWNRIVANDLENLPLGCLMMWIAALTEGPSAGLDSLNVVCIAVFLVGRLGHTYCYVKKIQPWRTVAWTLAALAQITLACSIVAAAFRSEEP